ncbi:recombinase family protein [Escherichia coli]|uniref:recombinase family protein n=1 Tax=Escherichia coli TaxID=562 RepID=UPI0020775EF1|nr:recombinase family protein [Escherichia coli]
MTYKFVPFEVSLFWTTASPYKSGRSDTKIQGVQLGHRAAIYCRVSTADQSCERQEFDLRAFAGCAGYDVVGIFKETGSGTKLDRAERKKVLGACPVQTKLMQSWSLSFPGGGARRSICSIRYVNWRTGRFP